MGHHHDHSHGHHHHHHGHDHSGSGNIKVAFFLNLIFTIIEIIGGFYTNSVAILSDALHDLGDSISLGLSWYLGEKSNDKRDATYSFGYKRFSLLGALINSIILIVGSIFILTEAIPRLWSPEAVQVEGMIGLAVLGLVFNGAAVFRLKDGETMNEKVVTWHLIEDVLGWAVVLFVSLVMYAVKLWGTAYWAEQIQILDPILSIGLAVFIGWNVFKSLRQTLKIFLQAIPLNVNLPNIEADILKISDVKSVHDVHAWSLDGAYNVLSLHVVLDKTASIDLVQEVKMAIRTLIKKHHIQHVTIEVECGEEDCGLKNC